MRLAGTPGGPPDVDVSEHVSRLVERLAGDVDGLRRASEMADACELSIVGRFDPVTDDSPSVNLSVDHIEFLSGVRASVDVEVIAEP